MAKNCWGSIKVAPSFWFLNINMPIFLLQPFSNCLRKTWFKNFLAVHRQNVDQIACLFLYVLLLEKEVF